MSSQYPVLGDKPIDQWRVTDLKDELKKRKLATKGLKDDLIRRLDEALRAERDVSEGEEGGNEMDTEEKEEVFRDGESTEQTVDNEMDVDKKEEVVGEDVVKEEETVHKEKDSGNDENANGFDDDATIKGKSEHVEPSAIGTSVVSAKEEETAHNGKKSGKEEVVDEIDCEAKSDVKSEDIDPNVIETPVILDTKVHDDSEIGKLDNNVPMVDTDSTLAKLDQGKIQGGESVFTGDTVEVVSQTTVVGGSVETITTESRSKVTVTSCSLELPQEDAVLNNPDNQVSEVSPSLGFQVKSDSISTDSVSINEKNELKDNLNADNFHIEHDNVMPEMVQPSSSDVPHSGGDTHPLDDQEPCGNQGSIEQIDDINTTNVDLSKKNDSADGGSSEKLNLDRSSGDDSMDEDALESKQVESNHISVEVEDKSELTKVHLKKEGNPVDAAGVSFSPGMKDLFTENNSVALPAEKRKLEDQEAVKNSEAPKRRRWNTEPIKVPDPPSSNVSVTPLTTPKDVFQSKFPKRNFNRSDSVLSGGDMPKERVVPSSTKPPTTSLKIDNFLRPFTLKAVQELLAKTGTVCSFWMDHIKTHCYVTFSSVEEAMETRNALYNLQWPPYGGKLLVADFVDPQEVKIRAEAPPQPSLTPVNNKPAPPSAPSQPQPSPRQNVLKQQLPPPPSALPPPPPSGPHTVKERLPLPLPLPPPPPLARKPDPPIVTLDDLFKKTKATPRIYYLPLSEEQVAAKLAAEGNKQN